MRQKNEAKRRWRSWLTMKTLDQTCSGLSIVSAAEEADYKATAVRKSRF
jgi:hypothetical protein